MKPRHTDKPCFNLKQHQEARTGAERKSRWSPLTVAHYSWPNGSGIGYNCRSAHLAVSNIVDPCLPLLVLLFSPSTAAATPIQSKSPSQSRFCSRINKDFCFIVLIYCPLKRILPHNKCIIITCYNCNTDHQSWLHINKTRRPDGFSMQHTSSKKSNGCVQPYWAPQNADPRMVPTQVDHYQTTTSNAWDDAWNDHIHNHRGFRILWISFIEIKSSGWIIKRCNWPNP